MTMNKKLIVYWNGIVKIDNEHNIIRDDGMLQRILDTIVALEAADKEIAALKAQPAVAPTTDELRVRAYINMTNTHADGSPAPPAVAPQATGEVAP